MTRISFKAFTSTLAAAAIALGTLAATTTPAAAMGKQDKQVLGALIGLGVLAAIVDSANDNRRDPPPASRYDDRRWDRDYDRDDRWRKPARVDRRHMIPAQCVENVRIRGKWREVVSGRCIAHNRVEMRLPRECRFDIRDRHGDRQTVFGRNCLEQEGYRITRR